MIGKVNKAWVSAAVSFAALTAATFFGFEIDQTLQAAIVAVIVGAMTWLVPNTEPEAA